MRCAQAVTVGIAAGEVAVQTAFALVRRPSTIGCLTRVAHAKDAVLLTICHCL
jgi:hypothetical protein